MPWCAMSTMSLRREFVELAQAEAVNRRALCRRFGISPKTGYKWIARFADGGELGLLERSRRPRQSPRRTASAMEAAVVAVRTAHPAWGGRKIRAYMAQRGQRKLPSASTMTAILRRQGHLDAGDSAPHPPWQRFEQPVPNALWQMDFKGHFALTTGLRCHPLGVLDDHSRYALCLQACPNQQQGTVETALRTTFRRYGLPATMIMDNGPPWGSDWAHPYTPLTVWLLRLGIRVPHGRPSHPQTQGKEERFHRTLQAEVLRGRVFADLPSCQAALDTWRLVYHTERPHEALQMATPASRYVPSARDFPDLLPPIEYDAGDTVRRVQANGELHYRGHVFVVGKAFHRYPVAVRRTSTEDVVDVYFCHQRIAQLDLTRPAE